MNGNTSGETNNNSVDCQHQSQTNRITQDQSPITNQPRSLQDAIPNSDPPPSYDEVRQKERRDLARKANQGAAVEMAMIRPVVRQPAPVSTPARRVPQSETGCCSTDSDSSTSCCIICCMADSVEAVADIHNARESVGCCDCDGDGDCDCGDCDCGDCDCGDCDCGGCDGDC